MDEKTVFDRINGMLSDSDYPIEIRDVAELEDFLNDPANVTLTMYTDIEQMYNQLLGYEEADEY